MRRFHFNERPDSFEIDPQHQLAQGLVFAGLGRYNGGLHYHDSSLYGNTGTLTNMDPATDWVWDAWLRRWTLNLDGSNDYVNCGTFSAATYPFSMSAWFRSNNNTNVTTIISANAGDGNNTFHRLFIWGSVGGDPVGAQTQASGLYSIAQSTTGITLAKWHHVVGVFTSASNRAVYLDGGSVGVGTASLTPTVTRLDIGVNRRVASPDEYFNGDLSDPLIFARALTRAEIQQLADPSNVMYSLGGSDPGLLRYRRKWWPVVSGAAVGKYWLWARRNSQVIGSGLGV